MNHVKLCKNNIYDRLKDQIAALEYERQSEAPDSKFSALQQEVALFLLGGVTAADLQNSGQDEVAHCHASHVNCGLR